MKIFLYISGVLLFSTGMILLFNISQTLTHDADMIRVGLPNLIKGVGTIKSILTPIMIMGGIVLFSAGAIVNAIEKSTNKNDA